MDELEEGLQWMSPGLDFRVEERQTTRATPKTFPPPTEYRYLSELQTPDSRPALALNKARHLVYIGR